MFSKKSFSLFLLMLIAFIDLVGIGLVYPMFASMLYQPGSTLLPSDCSEVTRGTCLGILLASMPIVQFFSAPILGMLSDKKGRKKILMPTLSIGVVGYIIAMIAVQSNSIFLLILSRIAVGISAGTASVVNAALADMSQPEEKSKNFGLLNMACGLGFTIGPFLGGILSETSVGFIQGYATPFALAGGVTLLNLILTLFFFQESYTPKNEGKLNIFQGMVNIKRAFSIIDLRVLFVVVFISAVGWSFYWEFTPVTWIESYGFSASKISNFYAYGAAVYALSCGLLIRLIIGKFSDRLILCGALVLEALAIGMLLYHTEEVWLWFYVALQQFAIALFWPTAAAVASNSVSDEVQGETLGVLHSMDALAFASSPLIAGPLLALSKSMPMIVGASAMLLASLVLAVYMRKRPVRMHDSVQVK